MTSLCRQDGQILEMVHGNEGWRENKGWVEASLLNGNVGKWSSYCFVQVGIWVENGYERAATFLSRDLSK